MMRIKRCCSNMLAAVVAPSIKVLFSNVVLPTSTIGFIFDSEDDSAIRKASCVFPFVAVIALKLQMTLTCIMPVLVYELIRLHYNLHHK